MSRKPTTSRRSRGFTLFEVLLALGVFALAVTGIAAAIDTAMQAGIEVRRRASSRNAMESRLAYCLADPPPSSGETRIIEAAKNNGIRVEETAIPWEAKNAQGQPVPGIRKLTVITKSESGTDRAEILLYHP